MRFLDFKKLKDRLGEYVRRTVGSKTVRVTDRDRVVAEIGPHDPTRNQTPSDMLLRDAIRRGWITPPVSVGRRHSVRQPVTTIDEVMDELQRDRADR